MTDFALPPTTPIADAVKRAITDAFHAVPDSKRGALLVLADEHGPRVMAAGKFGRHWKVAVETAKPWKGPVTGSIAIVGAW